MKNYTIKLPKYGNFSVSLLHQ
ncbi:stage V sporulation protein M [Parabacteroides absconsus]